MARLVVMPVIGPVIDSRLESLLSCHAIHERKAVRTFQDGSIAAMDKALGDCVRELAKADRLAALSGKLTFIVQVEV